jgi:NAD(P)-dependent dehydrogenase (short-subunit alcohol dehydrogenase family)
MSHDPFSLRNKTILITGASSGIGRQTSIDCSHMGANLILLGRRKQELEKTLKLLDKGNHSFYVCDITDFGSLEPIINQAVDCSGKIAGFVHSAGIESTIPLGNIKPEYYNKFFSTNVVSAFEITKTVAKKKYLDPEGASIVFIASIMGLLGQPGKTAYCSSKGALISGCKALALELAPKGIRVNCILPAIVNTEMTRGIFNTLTEESVNSIIKMHPLGLGNPEDVSNACLFLLSGASRWVTGSNLIIDGGYSAQ